MIHTDPVTAATAANAAPAAPPPSIDAAAIDRLVQELIFEVQTSLFRPMGDLLCAFAKDHRLDPESNLTAFLARPMRLLDTDRLRKLLYADLQPFLDAAGVRSLAQSAGAEKVEIGGAALTRRPDVGNDEDDDVAAASPVDTSTSPDEEMTGDASVASAESGVDDDDLGPYLDGAGEADDMEARSSQNSASRIDVCVSPDSPSQPSPIESRTPTSSKSTPSISSRARLETSSVHPSGSSSDSGASSGPELPNRLSPSVQSPVSSSASDHRVHDGSKQSRSEPAPRRAPSSSYTSRNSSSSTALDLIGLGFDPKKELFASEALMKRLRQGQANTIPPVPSPPRNPDPTRANVNQTFRRHLHDWVNGVYKRFFICVHRVKQYNHLVPLARHAELLSRIFAEHEESLAIACYAQSQLSTASAFVPLTSELATEIQFCFAYSHMLAEARETHASDDEDTHDASDGETDSAGRMALDKPQTRPTRRADSRAGGVVRGSKRKQVVDEEEDVEDVDDGPRIKRVSGRGKVTTARKGKAREGGQDSGEGKERTRVETKVGRRKDRRTSQQRPKNKGRVATEARPPKVSRRTAAAASHVGSAVESGSEAEPDDSFMAELEQQMADEEDAEDEETETEEEGEDEESDMYDGSGWTEDEE